ncbi:hypothetical protein M406DRAFT_356417 [Cryphonectria parasitica EP155]|uniref:Uncharacterized protein n=1 Tax=Cryphonectria parasitica (strain ATCC 38755 / EP155) TaxID=660469 RepID=A0A9P4Y0U6_CRYP1|nr:uncharacterized protein M406DRAFT_356417 [Cryphonectria parasitica EP155]KAF3764070.1 hypothetical protein M406DRAFT_356417 [Cryphonectria parasitica EP155]
MPAPVESGHVLFVDLFDGEALGPALTVKWQQNFSARQAQYYRVEANDLTNNETVPLFIAAEWYKNATKDNPNHISKIGETEPGEGYKVKIDGRFQYGQKNGQGENRFVIYHDKERKPYQHRFIETAVLSTLAKSGEGAADKVCGVFGLPAGSAANVTDTVKCYIGDYLHTF